MVFVKQNSLCKRAQKSVYRKQNLITSSREKERERENEINYDKTVQANYTEENPFKKYSIVPRDRKIHSKLDRFAFKVLNDNHYLSNLIY